MRIGLNPGNVDAVRRLEVFDVANAPRFRITQPQGSSGFKYADFQVTSSGDLGIFPFDGTNNADRYLEIQTV